LQREFIVIFIAHLRGGRSIQLVPEAGILRFNPLLLWRFTNEELALELAAAATRGRFRQAGFRDARKNRVRIARRAVLDRLQLARKLVLPDVVIARWQEQLAKYPTAHRPLAGARRADA
jgi:hypothetical protein